MPQWVPTDNTNPGGAGALADLSVPANTVVYGTLFCATARLADLEGALSPAYRSSQHTFARGYKEVTTIRISSGAPFRWRRIVFSGKALAPYLNGTGGIAFPYFFLNTSNGQVRPATVLPTAQENAVRDLVFRGIVGKDWFSPCTLR